MSLEEERARQAATGPAPAAQGAATATLAPIAESAAPGAVNLMDDDAQDEELAQALLLSQQDGEGEDVDMEGDAEGEDEGEGEDDEAMSEEEAIARAIEMSMNEEEEKAKEAKK